MAALMRYTRFSPIAKQILKLTRVYSIAIPRRRLINRKSKTFTKVKCCIRNMTSDSTPATAVEASPVEKLAMTLEGNIRRYGRISSNQLAGFIAEVEKEGTVSKQNSLLIIRCLGSLLYDEHPATRTKMVEEIWDRIQQMVDFDVTHYNAVLRAHLENGHEFSATKFLADMEAQNISPNRVTYQRLIARYCNQGDIQAATQILDHMKQVDLPINDYVFKSFITGHFKAGDPESAKDILNIMRQAGLEPNGDTYAALLCGYAHNGDYDAIRQSLLQAESEGVTLRPSHLLDVIFALTVSGHHQYIDQVTELLHRGPRFNHDAVRCVNQLVAHGYDDVAYKLYLSMPKPAQLDQQEPSSGRFLLRALAKYERPIAAVSEMVKDMKSRDINKDDLSAVAHLAYIMKKTDYALQVIEKMKSEGLPVRAHYFWPAVCQCRDLGDAQGIVNILGRMRSLCDTQEDFLQTVHKYAIPALSGLGESKENIYTQLQTVGFDEDEVNFAYFLWLIESEGLQSAIKFAEDKTMVVIAGGLRPYLVEAVRSKASWEDIIKALALCESKTPRKVLREVTGSVVFEILKLNKKNPDWSAVDEILDFLKLKELVFPGYTMKDIRETKFLNGAPGHLIEKLESLVSTDSTATSVQRTSYADMTQADLRDVLEKNTDEKGAQKWLLIKSCAAGNIEEVEVLKKKMDEDGFVLPALVLRQMAFMYALHTRNLDKAEEYLNRVETEFPDYSAYTRVVLQVAGLQAEQGKADEASTTLQRYSNKHRDAMEEFSSSYELEPDCITLVKQAATTDPNTGFSLLNSVFDQGYIRKASFRVLEAYIEGVLLRDNDDDVITAVEQIATSFARIPKLDEVCCRFINKEDPDRLQKVVDQATQIHGEMNVLHHLIVNFIECGHPKKAKKIIETPGLRAVMSRLTAACDKLVTDDKIHELEQLVNLTKDLFAVDRDEMLFQLIRGYVRQKDFKKALNVLTIYEEENIPTRDRTLRYLAKVLQGNNMEVPFDIPPVIQSPKRAQTASTSPKSGQTVSVSSAPAAPELSQPEKDMVTCLLAKDWDKVKEIGKSYDSASLGNIIKALSAESKIPEVRQLLKMLGDTGEVDKLLSLQAAKGVLPPRTNISHRGSLFFAYINSNQEDELMSVLEKDLDNLPHYLSERGIFFLGEKSPQHLAKLETLVHKLTDIKKRMAPINMLWTYYFVNQSPKADEIMQKYPELLNRLRVFKVCQEALNQNKPELLTPLLSMLKGKNSMSQAFVYSYLLGHHCNLSDVEGVLSVAKQLQEDGLQITDLRIPVVKRAEALLSEQNKTIPWDVSKTSQASSSNSDSSDSSDDEKR